MSHYETTRGFFDRHGAAVVPPLKAVLRNAPAKPRQQSAQLNFARALRTDPRTAWLTQHTYALNNHRFTSTWMQLADGWSLFVSARTLDTWRRLASSSSTNPSVELNSCQSHIRQEKRGLMRNSFPLLKTAEAAAPIFQLALSTRSAA